MEQYEYSIITLFVHLVIAIFQFIIINWLGKHSTSFGYMQLTVIYKTDEAPAFNFIIRVFTPIVFILIISTIFYGLKQDHLIKYIFLVNIYYFIIRILFNIARGRSRLLNWKQQINYFLWISVLSYVSYQFIIISKKNILPDSSFANELWILIILYIYNLFNKISYSPFAGKQRREKYFCNRYLIYKNKFGDLINNKVNNKIIESLIYSIIIYEAFNRPKLYRMIEYILFYFGKAKTLGIMQVTTKIMINDKESVELGIKKILDDLDTIVKEYTNNKQVSQYESYQEESILRKLVFKYNPDIDYYNEIHSIREILIKNYYPVIEDKLFVVKINSKIQSKQRSLTKQNRSAPQRA